MARSICAAKKSEQYCSKSSVKYSLYTSIKNKVGEIQVENGQANREKQRFVLPFLFLRTRPTQRLEVKSRAKNCKTAARAAADLLKQADRRMPIKQKPKR